MRGGGGTLRETYVSALRRSALGVRRVVRRDPRDRPTAQRRTCFHPESRSFASLRTTTCRSFAAPDCARMRLGGRAGGQAPLQYAGIPVPGTWTGIRPPGMPGRVWRVGRRQLASAPSWGRYANPGTAYWCTRVLRWLSQGRGLRLRSEGPALEAGHCRMRVVRVPSTETDIHVPKNAGPPWRVGRHQLASVHSWGQYASPSTWYWYTRVLQWLSPPPTRVLRWLSPVLAILLAQSRAAKDPHVCRAAAHAA